MESLEFTTNRLCTLKGWLWRVNDPVGVVIGVHGYKRHGREKKFIELAKVLNASGMNLLTFDFAGCGESREGLCEMSFVSMVDDLACAVEFVKNTWKLPIHVFAHSLGACIAVMFQERAKVFDKLVFMAPALDQKSLQRYWFARKSNRGLTWKEFVKRKITEKSFEKSLKSFYAKQAAKLDFRKAFAKISDKSLLIHGTSDIVVPFESVNCSFIETFIIPGGDHDLESESSIGLWTKILRRFVI